MRCLFRHRHVIIDSVVENIRDSLAAVTLTVQLPVGVDIEAFQGCGDTMHPGAPANHWDPKPDGQARSPLGDGSLLLHRGHQGGETRLQSAATATTATTTTAPS